MKKRGKIVTEYGPMKELHSIKSGMIIDITWYCVTKIRGSVGDRVNEKLWPPPYMDRLWRQDQVGSRMIYGIKASLSNIKAM